MTMMESAAHQKQHRHTASPPPNQSTDRPQSLSEWNNTQTDFSHEATIHQLFEVQAAKTPATTALISEEQSLSYRELNQQANRLAHYLQKQGVGPEVPVGVCLDRSPEMVISLLGILKAGGAYIPLDPNYPPDRLAAMMTDAGSPLLLTQSHLLDRLPRLEAGIIALDTHRETIAAESAANPQARVTPRNLAYIIYTSGSTGRPKGVMIEHRALVNFTEMAAAEYDIAATDRVLQFASISFDASAEEIYPCLTQGGTLVLRPDDMVGTTETFLQYCRDLALTVLDLPTSYWHQLVSDLSSTGLEFPPSLRLVIIGGEKAQSAPVAEWFRLAPPSIRLVNTYGPTEATVVATTCDLSGETPSPNVPIGRPLGNVEAYILNQHLQPVSVGEPGELHLGGEGLARGYLNRPDLTAEQFIPNPFSPNPAARLYKTGDLVRYRPDGNLEFLGRVDNQVKIRGFRIEPGEIEAALSRHPAVGGVVVLARADEASPGLKRLVAYLTLNTSPVPTTGEWRQFLSRTLPPYMIPAAFVILDKFPLNTSGKIDLKALPHPNLKRANLDDDFVAPATAAEKTLANIWAKILKIDSIGRHDNFFDLGGDSILSIQITSQANQAGLFFSPDSLFSHPTIAQLAAAAAETQPVEPAQTAATGPLTLTPVQQGILFHSNYSRPSSVYTEISHYELRGPLDVAAFKQAWQQVINRHAILRTFFDWENRETPQQAVRPQVALPWQAFDWQHLSAAEQTDQLQALLKTDRKQGFDLSQPPLLRLTLVRLAPDCYRFILSHHHIILDGWSVALLLKEVFTLYRATRQGEAVFLAQARPYPTYISWLQNQDTSPAEAYWREALRGFTTSTPLPTEDQPDAPEAYLEQQLRLSPAATQSLQQLARQHHLTLNTIMQGAWALLLRRYSGETDVLFGTAVSGRTIPLPGIEAMVGLFINSLPVRVQVSPRTNLLAWLQELQAQQVQARQWEYASLRDIQTWSEVRRARNESLFDSILSFNNYTLDRFLPEAIPDLEINELNSVEGSHYPISVLVDPGEALLLRMNYNARRFPEATITRMLQHFETLLEAMAARPDQPLSAFSLLTAAEKERLVIEFNRTAASAPAGKTVITLFEAQAAQTPEAVALRFGDESLTYAELNRRANQLAHYLTRQGVGPGQMVALYLDRSPEAVVAIWGTLKAGAGYVPLDTGLPRERLTFMLDETQSPVVLTRQGLAADLPGTTAKVVALDADWPTIAAYSADNPAAGAALDNLAYIIYTSGSTGKPKGAMIRHSNLINYIWWAKNFYLQGQTLDFPLFSSLSFDLTVTSLFVPLISGGSLVIYGESAAGNLSILDVIKDNQVDIIKLTPAHLALIKEINPAETRVRKMIVGGEDFKRSLAQSVTELFGGRVALYNEYGPTEATVGCMIHRFNPATDRDASVPIGRPINNAQVYIMDEHLNPVPPGVTGEMCIGGAGVGQGYLKRPDLTAAKFVDNPVQSGTLYRTGDLARWTEDGQMQFLGRRDFQVKVKGYRVELGEIESTLLAHPQVEAAVVTVMQPQAAPSNGPVKQCVQCGLPDNYPDAVLDAQGVCNTCRDFNALKEKFRPYFKTPADLQVIVEQAKQSKTGQYDCMVLYSGGKDSTYMLYQLVREMGLNPLVFSLDNGYISEEAKENMRRVTNDLGVDLVFGQTPHMNAVFVDSLKRHSNVCDGCYKVIYTLSINMAREKGINYIFTGLSRGQLFETRLSDMFEARIFDVDEIDRMVLSARKAYHRMEDAVKQLLDVEAFKDDAVYNEVKLIDFYRYTDVPLQEMYQYLDRHAPWVRPSDTGRSTNCLINDVGIHIHKKERGFHNYALPYSWDVRVGHKTRAEAVDELDDDIDQARVQQILSEIGYDETEKSQQLAAYVVSHQPLNIADLTQFLKQSLPDYMIPTHVVTLDDLPLTPNGKVDRQALPRPTAPRARAETEMVPPETMVEVKLAEIWQTILHMPQVGVHDNFFDLGGDSISSIQVMMQASKFFQLELSPGLLFEAPTIADLAERIENSLVAEIENLSDEEAEILLSSLT